MHLQLHALGKDSTYGLENEVCPKVEKTCHCCLKVALLFAFVSDLERQSQVLQDTWEASESDQICPKDH